MKSFLLMLIALIIIALITLPLIVINIMRKLYRGENIQAYFYTIAIGFDQAGGSILYGQEDWTVSSWTYYLWRKSEGINRSAYYFMLFINTLFMDRNHCEQSFYDEAQKQHFKPEWM